MQGAGKLRDNLKPNEKPVEVKEETQENIRQVKTVAGILIFNLYLIRLERFSIEFRKTKTKVITLANRNRCKHHNEPIRIRSNYM